MASALSSATYWCYTCSRSIRVRVRAHQDSILCPDCGAGFIEEIQTPTRSPLHHPFPSAAMFLDTTTAATTPISQSPSPPRLRRNQRSSRDRSPFNPVIVLRGPPDAESDPGSFELYYDDGAGLGIRPLPSSMSDYLMGSGFDRLLHQLTQLENGVARLDHPPASKAAIESMPVVKIADAHVSTESHCAVCKEPFELDSEAREMPCKHIYHSDCIFPWLSIRNSCPVCRHQLPTDVRGGPRGSGRASPENGVVGGGGEEETVGLTIWRLPGGGFAVGRFTGGRRAAEREPPVVYTEMDGGFNTAGAPRRISWASRRRARESSGFAQAFRSFFSFFGRLGSSRSRSGNVFSRSSRRRSQRWALEDN